MKKREGSTRVRLIKRVTMPCNLKSRASPMNACLVFQHHRVNNNIIKYHNFNDLVLWHIPILETEYPLGVVDPQYLSLLDSLIC